MTEDLLDYWLRLIKPLFPANAWIISRIAGSDHLIQIDWNLETDLHKQNRRSRKIELIIKEEVIDDYLDKNKDERTIQDGRMKEWISTHCRQFLLDDEAQTSQSTAPVKWRISRDVFTS